MNRPPKGDEYRRGNSAGMMFQPSANDTPDMTIRIKQGSFWINNEKFIEYEGGVSPVIEAPRSGAKWVVVALNKAGKAVLINGLPRPNNPEPPTLTQNMLPLAFVYVKSSTEVITNDMVYDARPQFAVGGYPINHADLQNRNKENSHDIAAITGLQDELDSKITSTDAKELIRNKADYNGTISSSFTLNIDDTGVPVEHCGIYVNRGSQPKVGIKFNEDTDEWQYTNDGTNWKSWDAGINVPEASATEAGIVKLSIDPENEAIAVGINDPKYLSIDEKISKNDLRNTYITREEALDKLSDKMDIEGTYSKDDINAIFVTKSSLSNSLLDTYTRGQIDSFLQVKANASQTYTKNDIDEKLNERFYDKDAIDEMFLNIDIDPSSIHVNLDNYYQKGEVDLLLKNITDDTYKCSDIDEKLENKVNNSEFTTSLEAKANTTDVYTQTEIDEKFATMDSDNKSLFYEQSVIDSMISERALLVHNHSSGDIIEDTAHRFVSDNQINNWNSKQDAIGFTPENITNKGIANGYAPLDHNSQIPVEYIPDSVKENDQTEVLDTYNDLLIIPDMNLKENKHYVVLDATGDPDGVTGKAEYVYHNNAFVCITNIQQINWNNITNKPDLSLYVKADDVYTKTNTEQIIQDSIINKANISDVYTKIEIDNFLENVSPTIDAYTKTETDNLLNNKADIDSIYTKNAVDNLLGTKANLTDVYTQATIDTQLSLKANANNVYTKAEVDNSLLNKANVNDVYTKDEINDKLSLKANANSVYTKTEVDNAISESVVDISGKADIDDVYTKSEVYTKTEVNDLIPVINNNLLGSIEVDESDIADQKILVFNGSSNKLEYKELETSEVQELPVWQEFITGDCHYVAYEEGAITFSKTANSIVITKNKEVKSVRFFVTTEEIGSNNRIFIDYDASATNNNNLTYDYADVTYIQLMGSKGATKVGTNIYYTNESNPHYCECALSFGNQGPVVVKVSY